jgi:hypothetical protein
MTGDEFGSRIIQTLAGTAATVAFGIAGVGLIAERWSHRQWVNRTGYPALGYLDRTCYALRAFTRCAEEAATPAIESRWQHTIDVTDYVAVPTDPSRAAVMQAASLQIEEIVVAAIAADTAARAELRDAQRRAQEAQLAALAAPSPELATEQAPMTFDDDPVNSTVTLGNVWGTDLGHMFDVAGTRLYMVFGDSYGAGSTLPPEPGIPVIDCTQWHLTAASTGHLCWWRSNTMAVIDDPHDLPIRGLDGATVGDPTQEVAETTKVDVVRHANSSSRHRIRTLYGAPTPRCRASPRPARP